MSKINSRQKGAAGERENAHKWNEILGIDTAIRGQQRSGAELADVVGVSDLFHIEVKRHHSYAIWKHIEQYRRDKKDNQIGLLCLRPNGDTDWHVAVSMDKLIPFCKEIVRLTGGMGTPCPICSGRNPQYPLHRPILDDGYRDMV